MEKCVEREIILIDRRKTGAKMIKTMQKFIDLELEEQWNRQTIKIKI